MNCYIVCRDRFGTYIDKVDLSQGIIKNGGFLEYSTETETISLDINDLIEIYFE